MQHPVHIIAEAGTNHNADAATARQLADAAKAAGADSIKFQLIYPEGLYLPYLHTAEGVVPNQVFEQRRQGMLDDASWREVAAYCREIDLPVSWSVFDVRGLDFLDEVDAPYIKIASCDLNNGPLLREAGCRNRHVIVSTGMSRLGEVEVAMEHLAKAGCREVTLLHCVSMYPAPLEAMRLSAIKALRAAFGVPVGLSDHTQSSLAAAAALAMGARVVEKHMTLDRNAPGFDHAYAMEPADLHGYITDIRGCQAAFAAPPFECGEQERLVQQRARRGLYASRALRAGEVLCAEDVLIVRPQSCFAPDDIGLIIGAAVRKDMQPFEPFSPQHLDLSS